MAVQKSRKTPSKRGMHRSHSALAAPAVSIDSKSGENPFPASDLARWILSRQESAEDQGGRRSGRGRRIDREPHGGGSRAA